jgi:hypothetical protein
MTGELCVLNVGAGDIKVVFNEHDEAERAKAIRMLTDMQQRGYAILVELTDGSYTRAEAIDASRGRYVVTVPDDAEVPAHAEPVPTRRRGRPRKVSIPVERAKAVGVARSAGG